MSNIDKQDSQVQRYANFGVDMMEWADGGYVKYSDYVALLDELKAAEKRIDDFEAQEEALRPVGVMSEKAFHRWREAMLVLLRCGRDQEFIFRVNDLRMA